MWIQDWYLANKCFLALRQKSLWSKMFLVAIESLLNSVAAECWKGHCVIFSGNKVTASPSAKVSVRLYS